MSQGLGPKLHTDADGHAVAHGYVITGDEGTGYRGRAAVPLTGTEAAYGVREVLFSGDLYDLLGQARAQLTLRSMVGTAAENARADGQRARGGEPGTNHEDARLAQVAAGEFLTVLGTAQPDRPEETAEQD